MDTTLLTTLGTLLAALASAYFGWRSIQAQTHVQEAQADVDRTKTETDRLLQQQRQLTEQANKLRQDLLDDNTALKVEVRELRQRVEDMEDRNSELRTQLRDCLERAERPNDPHGNPVDRRGRR